jgi:hypothetical protein
MLEVSVKKTLLVAALGVGLVLASLPVFAHHAGTAYDAEHPITLSGTVTGFELVSPHTQIHFEVKDEKGNVTGWVALSGPPQRMYRSGWKSDTLKAGDQITVTGPPSKDGGKYLGVKKIVANGKVLTAEGE